jgi:hypothetical protein
MPDGGIYPRFINVSKDAFSQIGHILSECILLFVSQKQKECFLKKKFVILEDIT